jgi:hypothetical protein
MVIVIFLMRIWRRNHNVPLRMSTIINIIMTIVSHACEYSFLVAKGKTRNYYPDGRADEAKPKTEKRWSIEPPVIIPVLLAPHDNCLMLGMSRPRPPLGSECIRQWKRKKHTQKYR